MNFEELPLSYAQQRLWFLDQLEPNSSFYNVPLALHLAGDLQADILEKSLQEIIQRHESLRTNFATIEGNPVQVIKPESNWQLTLVNGKDSPKYREYQEIKKWLEIHSHQPFDLANDYLIRATLLKLSDTEHFLLICLHHIVSDGWSMGVFIQELTTLYNAYTKGLEPLLPELPIQYADFAIWQREYLQGEIRQNQLNYWQKQLAAAPALLHLPTDRPRPPEQRFEGDRINGILSPELSQGLNRLSREKGVTLFMTLLTAFKVLLYRYTGQEDILVGTPIANRTRSELAGLIGFFVNTLVLRTDLAGNPSFSEALKQVRKTATDAYDHQDLPFEMLVEALQPERNMSYTPLFQVMFGLDNEVLNEMDLEGIKATPQPLEFKKAKFDLSLFIQVKEAGLTAHWEYNTDLFNGETIERMNGHFLALIEGIIANPSERISQLPLLTKSEQQQLLIDWNNTEVDYPVDKCIHQLFEEQVERTPDTVAVIFEEQELTYNELNCRANQLAHYLQSLGVKPDTLVGICIERSLEMIVGLLGILKAGGAYVPLDPDYPLERISLMLEDAGLKVLLTQQKLIDKLSESQANINIVCVDADLPVISKEEQKNLITTIKYSNLAYVIYTSGSTGIPKGVLVTHQGLLNLVFWHQNTFEITNLDKATQLAGTGFDAAVWELWPYLTAGASIYLVKPEILISLVELQKWLAAKKITISFLPTPIAEQLLSLEWTEINVSLRTILTGGDKLNQYPSNFIPFQVVNNYGPTENTVVTTSGVVISGEKNNSLSPAIGRPIFNTQIYILDSNLQPVPVGIPGEIHISGAGLARGYLNRPELTQEKFIPNPFSNSPDSRLYKTGDLARYLPDGNLEYLGRIDNQVKIRGFRIELGEIETILSQHSAVKTAIVIAREDETEQKRLVAYIIPQVEIISPQKEENSLNVTELRQFLKAKLPEYMIPSAFVILESLPLTPNGKTDYRALPTPEFQSQEQYIAPRNPIEEILSSIWAKVLKVAQVGIHDNFFELGGHSLLATQLISRIREAFQVEMPLRELFVAQTIAELAQVIKRISQQEQITELPILPRDKAAELPLSFAQTRLWFLAEFESNSSFYNIPLALRLEGTLNSQILIQSLEEICDRHEALRTNFITVDGIPTQIIQTRTWTVTVVDLQHLSSSEKVIASQELTQNQAIQPFDLASEPLIRITLVVLSETEHLLLVCMHHIVSDGWSMGVFLQELTALYNAYIQGLSSPLNTLSIQYGDFTLWQRQWLQGEVLQQQLDYWQKQLADAPALLSLPTDRPRPNQQSFAGGHLPFSLSLELTEKLTQLTQEQGVTLFMTLLTAYAVLLYRYTEQEDILIGTPIANRNRREIEGLIGFFVNTLVLRIDLSGKPNFNQLLGRVREMAMDAYAHQDLPFEMLVEVLQPERDLSHAPLFQVDFLLQNSPPSPLELTGLTATPLTTENDTAKFDLTLAMENTGAGLQGVWEYNTDLFDRSTIERLTGNFITLLEALVVNPQQPIFQLPLLTEVQSQELLEDWNATEKEYPFHHCVHHLFEEQAERTPNAVAVVFEGLELTYQQLNIQANQLAHYLQSLGVNSEVLVGIYLERSLLVIVGLLAVLKAGGAYLPLDPDYPQQRLTYMAEDAQISLLLTQESLLDSLPVEDVGVIVLDKLAEILTVQSPENPFSEVVSENLLCLLYTSGSTGKPKGVMLTHAALVNHSWGISEVFGLTESDRVLQFASFGFDVAAEEIFPTWLKGGTVVLRPGQMFPTLTDFADFIEQERLTVLNITPAYWHEWALAVSQSLATVPSSLRVVAVGGDAVLPETVNIWRQMVGKRVQCINVYGPTEASVTAIVHDLLDYQSEKINSVLIGRPIANTKAYILDQNLQPVPIGVKGELHLCGVRLARGYLNRPELTAEKFINNPFANAAFNRLYKTGDLARYLPDGNIECFGRIDNQVKIRGFRIELGEIEAVLNQNIDVQTSCVIIREDTPGDKYLVAYIVAHHERIPMISELRQFLSSKLPLYMVPQAFVFLESLPLTTNRKVDRRALPAPDKIGNRRDQYVAPRNGIEEMLVQIWTEILKVEQVGIYDNFFEIGGHSLLATQLVSRIRSLFKIELPLRSLFGAATVAELAHLIGQLQQQNLTLTLPPILPRTKDTELPLSFAQQRLWFLDQLQPNSALYNIPMVLHFRGNLNQKALEQSLQEICDRHEVLRTNFVTIGGQPTQVIQTTRETISVVDLQDLPIHEQEEKTQQLKQKQATQPFDLAKESLIRITLVVLSETEHLLLVCMHHIISDGWSIEVLIHELTSLYNAYTQNQPANLAPLPIQYADFAVWQKQWLQGDVLQSQLNYWQNQLTAAPPLLSLPTDHPRPAVQSFVGTQQEFSLSPKLSQALTELSHQQGVTLFMTLLAAFDALLYRYTGSGDILVGTPIANRNRSEIEGLIGFFVNTLVMRTDLSDNPSFSQLLTRVREVTMDAYAHQDLPFEMLVEALQPERDLSHTPLFQVAFVLQNTPKSEIAMTGLTVTDLPPENTTAKFDLTLAMVNTDDGLKGVWEYNTDLFESSTIERLSGHFINLLEGIAANPQARISQLTLLTESETNQLLIEWNNTQVDYPEYKCIHQLFEEQVKRTPDAVAVVCSQQQLTYNELNCRANQLAHYLQKLGVKADTLVGISLERSLEMIVGLLGILKAGGAYLPLDPDYPSERLQFAIADAQLSLLLTQERLLDKLTENQAQLILLEQVEEEINQNSQDNLTGVVTANNLANLIYTSGSTGKPKGVMVEHRGLFNLTQAQIKTFNLDSDSRILQFASLNFDASIWEILMAMGAGATLYLSKKDALMPGLPLMERLKDYAITHITLPPSALAALPLEEIPELQTIIVAGEACSEELIKQWATGRNFFNAYGPTETSVCATVEKWTDETLKVTIGRPIANTQVYILDCHLQPVPIGVPGELHIGGMGLARGYLNRPELTQEKFIPNPFSNYPDSRLYKTGDLARYLPDGKIEYLGRIDNQVKIRGFRIELGEIEALLNQNEAVQSSCVIVREDNLGDKRLVAYVVPQPEINLTINEIRQFLRAKLPDYMVPTAFVLLDTFPLTPNGKIDRRALPVPDLQSQGEYIAPRNPIEEKIAQIWAEVLKLERVSIEDNFFELGGHSLLATQVISRCQEAFEIALPLRYLFESPTIAQLSAVILKELQTGLGLKLPSIVPVNREDDIPLSWAQERLWFVNQLEGESGAYTIDLTMRLRGNLNIKALEKAFQAIIQRHEPLRTQFKLKDNKPIQAIASNVNFTLPVVQSQPLQVEQLLIEAASEPFDLANGSVLRVKLWQVKTDEYVLLLAIHHIAADGWSVGVLIDELSAYYRSFCTGTKADLPDLSIQYADFALWQRQWLTNEVLDRQLSYWKQQLTGVPLLHQLPTDRPRPAIQSFRGGTEGLQLDSQLTQQLKKLSQESGSTLFMTLLAGFAVLLSRYSQQTDVVIGSPIANRNRTEIEGLIGFFVNTLVLRFDLSQDPNFEDFLTQVRQTTQDAYDHQDLPFEMLVEKLQIERHLDRNPLTQIVFALQNAPSSPWDLPGLNIEEIPSGLDSVRVDLEVYLWDAPEGLGGFCSYNRDLFAAETIVSMMNHFKNLLAAIVENLQQSVALLPLLTPEENYQLLEGWNETKADYSYNKCIHQLIEEQAERTPDAVAVVFESQQLTYAELNSQANQLAHYLRSLGVENEVIVGLCVERSLDMIVALIGILKAGAAYLPLDPEYPQARLQFMLEDSQVPLLLTQSSLIDKLPNHQAKTVFLAETWEEIKPMNRDNLTGKVTASNLANVIYTSGSTGKPKGVMVEHQGLCNLALAQIDTFAVSSQSRVLQFASFSFDACISEVLMALGAGAALYLANKDNLMPGLPLIKQLRDNKITHITLPPSALAVLPWDNLSSLQTIIVAGEACSPELVKKWSQGRNFFNGYGPTEGSVCATIAKCTPVDEKITIGRPIPYVQVYILDSHLQPVPIGVPGELHIGGAGVARGYLNRPELTQEKFIPSPFEEPGLIPPPPLNKGGNQWSKLYKTGDLARYLPDGRIEYLGRIDNQVKVRGFRLELGEIEAVLSQHPLVQEAVVIARADQTSDHDHDQLNTNLVAYLVPALKDQVLPEQLAQWQSEYVSDWQKIYEESYSKPQPQTEDPTFNISGWNSSYTGQAIPAAEMREWVDQTVSRILGNQPPQRVLEIGCGSGLLLFRVAKHCQEYWGADYSSATINNLEHLCSTIEGLEGKVKLLHRTADDFTGIPQATFDRVVINSVVQYFPSVDYLLQVIAGAVKTIADQGQIFLGDIRSLPLLEPYHAAVQLARAEANKPLEQWQKQVNQSVATEEELLIEPQFFIALKQRFPRISWVEIAPKRGQAQNELTQFRYDVTLHLDTDVQKTTIPWLNWQRDRFSLAQLQDKLKLEQPEYLGIRDVPNQRLQKALQILDCLENPPGVTTVGELRQLLEKNTGIGINPEQMWQLGEQLGYTVHLSWWEGSQDGSFDVVFCRQNAILEPIISKVDQQPYPNFWDDGTIIPKSWTDYTNNPLYGKLVQKLVPQVREFVQQKLPNYMVPQAFVLLNTLPLTPNGKVDRLALPTPDTATRNLATGFLAPRTAIETQMSQIWSEVLGVERIGIKDNFFELGGHSLLATQVISRSRDLFSVELSLQNLLEYPTIANLAEIIEVLSVAPRETSMTETLEDYEEGEL
ncbi:MULTISPECIES: non-ribosomal peptide synthase/polyketide synthase [unclassified Microcystis]|uniref:non-ribosomal peptide synthase/polyketide synthase n=1 Tax=unclassified Microcystis TaxID=2643300 RepID=UPI00119110B1|nr:MULTISPECIES: non-ribosomal peptide synthase/polyketide synthase [unclassified Microcystis]MCA2928014.1 non-ribosomal peptide synthase/polyketide synthase [Microcystis sp. M020S1]MCA2937140.1 non-ribosomal peptide synthase/polyketide synthase [Microcystis sp. M015S1]MCA2621159.1 non-ribosomal peptide synthase/polyketide synthase [Microcystis sp. M099S2]MCA2650931.1 non-ribosomal peptide synthase/polyketide synthase [Microcystis sp. M065S2]MCA2679919.1 non-ribosomal peptide synthase/polyketi